MNYCIINIKTQTSTFRDPDFQNFHKSLQLPPPTTIIGLIGASMGLSPSKAQDFFYQHNFEIGIYGKTLGKTTDLWKYNNFKDGSIIHREILFKNNFLLAIGHENEKLIDNIVNAFLNPYYALTLGSSDSIAFIENIDLITEVAQNAILSNCLLPGDIVNEVIENADKGLEFSIYSTSDPITYNLPVKFHYESEYGVRKIIERKQFSFIGEEMKLNVLKKGVKYQDVFIPTFTIY